MAAYIYSGGTYYPLKRAHVLSGGQTLEIKGTDAIYKGGSKYFIGSVVSGAVITKSSSFSNDVDLLDCTVNSGGSWRVLSGCMANSTTVNTGGSMYVGSGGTALQIKENGGSVGVANGANVTFISNSFSGLVLNSRQEATVHSGTTANSTTVNSYGIVYVNKGGTVTYTIVNSGGRIHGQGSNGVITNTTVNSGGYLGLYDGILTNVIANSGGDVQIFGGSATGITILDGGRLSINITSDVYAQCTIAGVSLTVQNGIPMPNIAYSRMIFRLSSGTTLNSTVVSGGVLDVTDGVANKPVVSGGGRIYVRHKGIVNSATIYSYEGLFVTSGTVSNTVVSSGGGLRLGDGTAYYTTINSGGDMTVWAGGMAYQTTVNSGGDMTVWGGTAASITVNSGGSLRVSSGATALDVVSKAGGYVYSATGAYITYA